MLLLVAAVMKSRAYHANSYGTHATIPNRRVATDDLSSYISFSSCFYFHDFTTFMITYLYDYVISILPVIDFPFYAWNTMESHPDFYLCNTVGIYVSSRW